MRAGGAKTLSSGTAAAERDNGADRLLLFDVAERLRTFEEVDDLFAFVSREVGEYLGVSSSLFAEVITSPRSTFAASG